MEPVENAKKNNLDGPLVEKTEKVDLSGSPNDKENYKISTKSKLLIGFATFLLLGLSLIRFIENEKPASDQNTENSEQSTRSDLLSDTNKWKEYINRDMGFTLKYPGFWDVEDRPEEKTVIFSETTDSAPQEKLTITIDYQISPEMMKKLQDYYLLVNPQGNGVEKIEFGGMSAISSSLSLSGSDFKSESNDQYLSRITSVDEQNEILFIITTMDNSERKYEEVYNKVLESFKLIPSDISNTQNWNKYDTENYSLKYPTELKILIDAEIGGTNSEYHIGRSDTDKCIRVTENVNLETDELELSGNQDIDETNLVNSGSYSGVIKKYEAYELKAIIKNADNKEVVKQDTYLVSKDYQLLLSYNCPSEHRDYKYYERILSTVKMNSPSLEYESFMEELDNEIAELSSQE